ncbi:MAG: hypothetical protein IKF82_05300 [Bacilli bacterium]|nr:hypothetical protein [Bacilli bacterium]
MEELVDEIIKRSKSILGVQEIIYSESEKKLKIESTEVANVVDELEILSTELSNSFDEYSKEKNKLKQKYIEKRIIDVFLFKSIFNKNVTTSEDTFIVDIQSFHKFVENLVELASSAYEQRMCTSSFILVKFEEEEVEKLIKGMNLDYVKMSKLTWSNIKKYSAASRLVDALSISYVVDKNYNIVGFARKKKGFKSVKDLCLEIINENFDYVYFENKKILWCTEKNKVNIFENGNWKIKNYNVICDILDKFTKDNSNNNFKARKKENTIHFFVENIRFLSENNIGALFSIIGNNKHKSSGTGYNLNTIFEAMLVAEDNELKNEFIKILSTNEENELTKINRMNINRLTLDPYLLRLISDVDGSVILDGNLLILDFGKMIKSQDVEKSSVVKKLFDYKENNLEDEEGVFISSNSVVGGARSKGTFEASTFGMAIKVSEDGGISIYERRKLIFEL